MQWLKIIKELINSRIWMNLKYNMLCNRNQNKRICTYDSIYIEYKNLSISKL